MTPTPFDPREVAKETRRKEALAAAAELCDTMVEDDSCTWLVGAAKELLEQRMMKNRAPQKVLSEEKVFSFYGSSPEECLPGLASRHFFVVTAPAGSRLVRHRDQTRRHFTLEFPGRNAAIITLHKGDGVWVLKKKARLVPASGRCARGHDVADLLNLCENDDL